MSYNTIYIYYIIQTRWYNWKQCTVYNTAFNNFNYNFKYKFPLFQMQIHIMNKKFGAKQ